MSDIEAWLAAQEAQSLETLKAFCRIESVSTDPPLRVASCQAADFVADSCAMRVFLWSKWWQPVVILSFWRNGAKPRRTDDPCLWPL